MNNNSIEINRYLQHEMSADERTAFEARLASDTTLQEELKIQQQVIDAAINAGIKAEFAKAIRVKTITRRLFKWGIAASIVTIVVLFFTISSNKYSDKKQDIAMLPATNSRPFINPPLPGINVPLSEYSFDAEKGDIIYHSTGSIIYFPPHALVDELGNMVKGIVKVTYREFADPVDFFVSGIPMQYDSAGVQYNFESSGMCEINAYKDNKAVFVNPAAQPQINLSGNNKSPLHNLYFLDTVAKAWKFTGKDVITEVKNIAVVRPADQNKSSSRNVPAPSVENDFPAMAKPLKPTKASGDRQAFSIAIDPGSFEELFAYDNVKFEVLDESTYKRSDAEEHWNNVKLERSTAEGIYNITFTNTSRKVTYKVRPVLEGADYDAALKVFNEKEKQYEQTLKSRLVKDKQQTDSISFVNKQLQDRFNAAIERNNKLNALIIERNKRMKEEWERNIAAIEAKYTMDMRLSAEVMRTFTVRNFGVWNCDHPQYPYNEVPISASYTDSINNTVAFTTIAVVYKGFNGLTQFPSSMPIRVMPGQQNMLWSVKDSLLYYFTYEDFTATAIARDTKTFTFKMRSPGKAIKSYDEIRALLNKITP